MRIAPLLSAAVTVTLGACSSAPASSPADTAACAQITQVIEQGKAGTPLGTAVDQVTSGGWPNGQPSAAVRGVFNAFRSAAAAQQNAIDGSGTLTEANTQLQAAMDGYNSTCQ